MKAHSLAIALVLIAVPSSTVAEDDPGDALLGNAPAWYGETRTLVLDDVRDALDAGQWDVEVQGETFELSSTSVPVNPPLESADGVNWTIPNDYHDYPFQEYEVLDEERGARGFVSLTKLGVSALIQTDEESLIIEPPTNSSSHHELQVISDLDQGLDLELPSLSPEVTATATGDRQIKMQVDSLANSGSCASCHVSNTYSMVRGILSNHFSWNIVSGIQYLCSTSTCDNANGLSSSYSIMANVLDDFIAHQYPQHSLHGGSQGWEVNMGITGKVRTTSMGGQALGIATLPGHYAVTVMKDTGFFDYRSSSYENAINWAHELGHVFDATHHSSQTTRTVYEDYCTIIEVPVVGVCILPDQRYDYTERTRKIMHNDPIHEPPEWIVDDSYLSSERNTMNTCNLGSSWSGLDYDTDTTGRSC